MKTILFSALASLLFASSAYDKLMGRWESVSPATGNVTGVVFREDGSFEGYVNQKPFVSGSYTLRDSIFELQDNGCMGITGIYKITFFSNDDSIRLQLIQDLCEGRGTGVNNRVFGRVK
jgi:hypothetical protein